MSNIKFEESFFTLLGKALFFIFDNAYAAGIGIITSFIGYLLPIRNIVHYWLGNAISILIDCVDFTKWHKGGHCFWSIMSEKEIEVFLK